MPQPHLAVPAPSAETRPFWEAAARGKLELARCTDCERLLWPPLPRCPDCLSSALVWTEVSGRGRLRGWTDNHVGGQAAPLCIAECAIEEDPRAVIVALDATGSVRDLPPDALVRIIFRADANGWTYPVITGDRS